jgi:hypothetical protein
MRFMEFLRYLIAILLLSEAYTVSWATERTFGDKSHTNNRRNGH